MVAYYITNAFYVNSNLSFRRKKILEAYKREHRWIFFSFVNELCTLFSFDKLKRKSIYYEKVDLQIMF